MKGPGLTLAATLLLSACTAPSDRDASDDTATLATPAPAPTPAASLDGSERIERRGLLLPIRTEDIENAELKGELACAFTNLKGHTLLIARANVGSQERSMGLARTGQGPILLMGLGRGGFGALETRAALGGEDANIWVETQGEPLADRSEAATRNASLRFTSGAEEPEPVPGTWTCGP
ncbi:hypothetical protein [Novosphingobium aquimarinum]|uniref:hypothetical protein n=1 Tax=Novosphingobium aquimarinum TaxID=2682494 RepID=UPI0012EC3266|nr:hypothetical protein [Novosphingobium aquimarinum]